MKKQEFEHIRERITEYTHTSLTYTDWQEVMDYTLLSDTADLLALYGKDAETGMYVYHFAANRVEALITVLEQRNPNEKLTFVPEDWIPQMEALGFGVHAVWNDYFALDMAGHAVADAPCFLKADDAEAVSQVTMACRNQSRGFTGQTAEWVCGWLSATEPACPPGTSDTAILGDWKNGALAGVACIGVYGQPGKRILWVREIAVLPEAQGRGVARRLIGQAFAYGLSCGAETAFLMADTNNAHAIRAYTAMGFVCRPEDAQTDMLRP